MDLKVLIVSHGFPPYAWGGVEAQTLDLATSLADLGVYVTVCCGGSTNYSESEYKENLRIVRLPMIEIPPRFLWFQIINRYPLMKEVIKSDVIHSQATSFTINSFFRGVRKPWIVSFHGSPLGDLRVMLGTSPQKWSSGDVSTHILGFPVWASLNFLELTFSDRFIVCGNSAAQDVISLYDCDKSKMRVIPNGVDFSKFEKIMNNGSPTDDNDGPTIFYSGRLYWRKGIEYLIEAMPIIVKEHKNVILKVFGKGPLEKKISTLVSSLHLERNVKLMGYVPYNQLIKELYMSDIAVFPSLYEGLSIAMLEAMACSKPVVAFNYPFASELIKNMDNGVLVPPKDTLALSKEICYLLSDEGLRKKIASSAYELVKKKYNWSTLVHEYLDLYKEVTGCI